MFYVVSGDPLWSAIFRQFVYLHLRNSIHRGRVSKGHRDIRHKVYLYYKDFVGDSIKFV